MTDRVDQVLDDMRREHWEALQIAVEDRDLEATLEAAIALQAIDAAEPKIREQVNAKTI